MNRFREGLGKFFSSEDLAKIRQIRIGIAGAGGLGSNCAMHLVRSGFENFVIVDHDMVEASNLNRQFFFSDQLGEKKVEALRHNLQRINPKITVRSFYGHVDSTNVDSFFGNSDVIVEAFDDVEAKKMLVEHFSSSKKLVIAASGIAGCGKSDGIQIKKVNPLLYIVGDFISGISEDLLPYSPGVSIAAAKQADIVLYHAVQNKLTDTGLIDDILRPVFPDTDLYNHQ